MSVASSSEQKEAVIDKNDFKDPISGFIRVNDEVQQIANLMKQL